MKRSLFFAIAGVGSLGFGIVMYLFPEFISAIFGMKSSPETSSLYKGLAGLIIGSGVLNFLVKNEHDSAVLKKVLIANMVGHFFGITADIWGLLNGVLSFSGIAPVELVHLFVGLGSFIYYRKIKIEKNN
ncbi:hypothetical protein EYY60_16725 [Flavobacterium zhairuonense]|uniref:hypothetical protein n=1 Tax=Flavobacterium zhairuonense TaxID=2493631 RepID=UPI0010473807|nr:hypothetical protein [Flavobacterium zhairuonense]KAF2508764.1 hypothetical protein EYY60_16725 [Flavobacterium zhairuonense]